MSNEFRSLIMDSLKKLRERHHPIKGNTNILEGVRKIDCYLSVTSLNEDPPINHRLGNHTTPSYQYDQNLKDINNERISLHT